MSHPNKPDNATRDPVAVWDGILDLVAEDDAETGEPTEDDIRWSQSVDAAMKSRLAELRRQLTPTLVPVTVGVPIPPEIQALDRQFLISRLESLRQSGNVRYSHQELRGLSDNDLRTMLALAVRVGPTER